jgi:hypothetical protein
MIFLKFKLKLVKKIYQILNFIEKIKFKILKNKIIFQGLFKKKRNKKKLF